MQGATQKNSLHIEGLAFDHVQFNALIEELGTKGTKQSRQIMRILKAIKKFYVATSPACQHERDQWIQPVYIEMIFAEIGAALADFKKELCGEKMMINISIYCQDAIATRLKEMMRTHDKIYQHYQSHENQLKKVLDRSITS